ncbi:TetR/AcrR family transcriptional regulator [Paenibacillus albus]|uniref:TetR/AcrR family transcriptional regulator n=1 Tax=Paenibacillus albus TaxID=2495582 RepID=UPI001D131319|nr:TetR family transcriptional regulator [Paenibacillus albus]
MTDQAETKTDPRVLRTRRLIMDAFSKIIHRKDFKDVTVKDITTEATINRATFYYHFLDKYELLEKVLQEDMMGHVIARIKEPLQLNEDTIKTVFVAIT